jgi:hypothetical protein
MATILPFKTKKNQDDNLDNLVNYIRGLIFDTEPSKDRMEFKVNTVSVFVSLKDVSYEEQRWIHFTKDQLMPASGIPSIMLLTEDVSRYELYLFAHIDFRLWSRIPHDVAYFTLASKGRFEYNFRTKDHRITNVLFKLNN